MKDRSNYKEIVTKAVISKGKRKFSSTHSVEVSNPSTVLGCWVINHNFNGIKKGNKIVINGSYDVNIWYSYDDDTNTTVVRETNTYEEIINMRDIDNVEGEEIVVRSLKQPNPIKIDIQGNKINYIIEKELGVELIGDIKVKIDVSEDLDNWDEIGESFDEVIDKEIKEDYIDDNTI